MDQALRDDLVPSQTLERESRNPVALAGCVANARLAGAGCQAAPDGLGAKLFRLHSVAEGEHLNGLTARIADNRTL